MNKIDGRPHLKLFNLNCGLQLGNSQLESSHCVAILVDRKQSDFDYSIRV